MTLVPEQKGYKPCNSITCKWMYRAKLKSDGSLEKYKLCVMTRGYKQKYGVDYSGIFYPVIKPQTIRVVLTISLTLEWDIKQLDINNAFLNGNL